MPKPPTVLRSLRVFCALLAPGILLVSCRDATEITLHVHTNLLCTDPARWKGVAVYAGASGSDIESKAPALTTTACDVNGEIGTLVVVPSGSKDAEVALRVVAGIDVKPEECAARHYAGCIVARRTVRFNAHDSVDLDVELTSDCVNLGCDESHTCVDGACADSETEMVALAPNEPRVRCGDQGIFCATTGDVCCLTVDVAAQTSTGVCKPSEQCDVQSNAILACDDSQDCTPDAMGRPRFCQLVYTISADVQTNGHQPEKVQATECTVDMPFVLEMCQSGHACRDGMWTCHASVGIPANPLPNYLWCDIN
jgi:hypothetical protein